MTGSASRAVKARNAALTRIAGLIGIYRTGGGTVTADTAAELLPALLDLRVRDDAWARMDPVHNHAHRRLWTDLAGHAAPGLAAPPYALLAFTEWQAGDLVAAQRAVGQALADQPRYSMALIIWQAIAAGMPQPPPPPMTPEEVAAAYDQLERHPTRI